MSLLHVKEYYGTLQLKAKSYQYRWWSPPIPPESQVCRNTQSHQVCSGTPGHMVEQVCCTRWCLMRDNKTHYRRDGHWSNNLDMDWSAWCKTLSRTFCFLFLFIFLMYFFFFGGRIQIKPLQLEMNFIGIRILVSTAYWIKLLFSWLFNFLWISTCFLWWKILNSLVVNNWMRIRGFVWIVFTVCNRATSMPQCYLHRSFGFIFISLFNFLYPLLS